MEQGSLRRLLITARRVTAERNLNHALDLVVSAAREITGALHVALAVLDRDGTSVARLIAAEGDDDARHIAEAAWANANFQEALFRTGAPGRGANFADEVRAGEDADAAAPGRGVLAVPVFAERRLWGYVYLADARGGEFTQADERAALILSAITSMAIEHALLLEQLPAEREQAQRELRRAEAMIAMARVLERDQELQEVVELIAEEGRYFIEARVLAIFLPVGDQLDAVAVAVDRGGPVAGFSFPLQSSLAQQLFDRPHTASLEGEARPDEFGLRSWLGARSALLVPISFVGRVVGAVGAFDRLLDGPAFDDQDQHLLRSFADAAATAIVVSRFAQSERAKRRTGDLEREHDRLAQELHDETLQALGMLRLTLSSALRTGNQQELATAVDSAISRLDQEIEELVRLIEQVRPAALAALGLEDAIRALAENAAADGDFEVEADISLAGPTQLPGDIEHVLYRTAQESLRNVVKHAGAEHVYVGLRGDGEEVELRVADDGRGIGARPGRIGFGLLAMRDRVEGAGGLFDLSTSATGGTTVRATFSSRASAGSQAAAVRGPADAPLEP